MKKSISIIVSVLMYGLIIFLSCYYVILPNVKTINETKKTRKLTSEEIELRKFKFFDIVFRDIDELLCSHIISIG